MIKELIIKANKIMSKECDYDCNMCKYNKELKSNISICEQIKFLSQKEEILKTIEKINKDNLENIEYYKRGDIDLNSNNFTLCHQLTNELKELADKFIDKSVMNNYYLLMNKSIKAYQLYDNENFEYYIKNGLRLKRIK